jgi:Protein of unknown function (DUF1806)
LKRIEKDQVQKTLSTFFDQDVYLHLETTNGAYTSNSYGAFIRNAVVRFHQGKITGNGPYRVGLKMKQGWIYAEGLTHWDSLDEKTLILTGIDSDGRLTVSLQLSFYPFE